MSCLYVSSSFRFHLLEAVTEKTAVYLLCYLSIVLALIVVCNKYFLNNNFRLLY